MMNYRDNARKSEEVNEKNRKKHRKKSEKETDRVKICINRYGYREKYMTCMLYQQ